MNGKRPGIREWKKGKIDFAKNRGGEFGDEDGRGWREVNL
jgi:hypothetical protein